jgi:galactose oxidase-like protein/carboxypeptidase family protein/glyoxal oxidase-like protein/Kelch motif protein
MFGSGPRFRICFLLCSLLLTFTALGQSTGSWSPMMSWPGDQGNWVPTHAILLPTGKVLFFDSYGDGGVARVYDPATNTVGSLANPAYNVFCQGHAQLGDGRLFSSGGHIQDFVGMPHASIYNWATNTWTQVPDMNAGRWYPTNTTLSNGDVLVISGTIDSSSNYNEIPQVYQVATNSWRTLSSAQFHTQTYPFMFLAPNGKVFLAGWNPDTRYLDTSGTGAWTFVANHLHDWRNYGTAVMYDAGKILVIGGDGDTSTRTVTNTAEKIDLNAATPAWSYVASMHYARRQLNATLLPDGTVLVTGGSSHTGFDDYTGAVLPAEIYNPATNTWTVMASMADYRGYHSWAVLLPDARVLVGGGQLNLSGGNNGSNAQIFSPPYLFNGARPTITSAPSSVAYGQTALVGTSDAVARVTWIRLGAVTHSFNQDQRFLNLGFAATSGGVNVTFPSSANLSPPGYYMLFLLNSAGVPSVAKIIKIGGTSGGGTGNGAISGHVSDVTSGNALSGATVSYSGGSTTTDASGNYTLNNVAAGSYTVTASLTGYLSRSQSVTVTSGATTTANFQLTTAGIVAGTVKNTNGVALSGTTVTITGGNIATTLNLTTDANGNYNSGWIPIGNYTVTAAKSGYVSQTQSATVSAGVTSTVNFALAASTTTAGAIAGKVTNASTGAGVSGATVSYSGSSTTTDTYGNYKLSNVAPGTYAVTAAKSGLGNSTQTVTVTSGTTTTANFKLAASGKIAGTVKNASGVVISGATVTFKGGVIATTKSVTTSSTGTYLSGWIPVGSYTVTVSKSGFTTQSKSASVTAGTTTTMNFTMQ